MAGSKTTIEYSFNSNGPGWKFWVVLILIVLVVAGVCYTMDEILGIG